MRRLAIVVLVALSAMPFPVAAKGAAYKQPVYHFWSTAKLDVIVVPPGHGPLFNAGGALGGGGAEEIGLKNSYIAATEDSIAEYSRVVRKHGPRWLAKRFRIKTYVAGRDQIPQRVLNDPEAIIVFNEHQGFILGVTFTGVHPDCLISNSMAWTASYSYSDMYTVNLHEFGHCLGLDHFQGPDEDPIFKHENMTPAYQHDVGVPGTHRHCVSNMNLAAIALAFAPSRGLEAPARAVTGGAGNYRTLCRGRG